MQSVFEQTYLDLEYILIDGDSSDGSKDIITNHQDKLAYWSSEPDNGVYNAMNKGIGVATGDYLFFLNSGDIFNNKTTLKDSVTYLKRGFDIIYGDIIILDSEKNMELRTYPDKLSFDYFFQRTLPHQAIFTKRSLFETVFFYNENLKIVSDWEFLICAICKYNCSYKHIDVIISHYDDAFGISSLKENKAKRILERQEVLTEHFPLFMQDYETFQILKWYKKNKKIEMLLELDSYYVTKKLTMVFLKFLKMFT